LKKHPSRAPSFRASKTGASRPLVYVLVVNWNRWLQTLQCLDVVLGSTYEPFRVVVIDNGSSGAPPTELPPAVELLQTGRNFGYAGGNNVGIRHALAQEAKYVWILNNDAEPRREALAELVAAAERDPNWGALTSMILLPDGSEDAGLIGRLPPGERWDPVRRPYPLPVRAAPDDGAVEEIALLRGPSLLLRSDALGKVGLFDESYFHYLEEMDLMERLVRVGWRLGLVRASRVTHAKGATLPYDTPQSLYYLHRNHFRFEQKLFGAHPMRVVLRHPLRRLRALLALRATLRGDIRPLVAQARAFRDAVRGRTGPIDLGERYLEPVRRPRGK
jgi:GT2 family glycosyltransferase